MRSIAALDASLERYVELLEVLCSDSFSEGVKEGMLEGFQCSGPCRARRLSDHLNFECLFEFDRPKAANC